MRIGRFAVGEGGADLLREIDRQSSLAVVRDESAGRTDIAWGYIRRAGALVEIAVPPNPGFDPPSRPRSDAAVEHPRLDAGRPRDGLVRHQQRRLARIQVAVDLVAPT